MRSSLIVLLLMQSSTLDQAVEKLKDAEAKAENALQKVAVGDDYMTLAGRNPKDKARLVAEAVRLYGDAWPGLEEPLKGKLRERLRKMARFPRYVAPIKQPQANGWLSDPGVQLDSTYVRDGIRSVRISMPKGRERACIWSQGHPALPGKEYEFSAWVFSDETEGVDDDIELPIRRDDGKLLAQPTLAILPDRPYWRRVEAKFTMPGEAFKWSVMVRCLSKQGALWVDSISVKADDREVLGNGSFEAR